MNLVEDMIQEICYEGMVFDLDCMRKLLQQLENPQNAYSIIHVAGTNGKGSVSSWIANILEKAGYRTGLYRSPAVFSYHEIIKVNDIEICENQMIDYVELIKGAISMMEAKMRRPTKFEIETAIALLHFQKTRCQYVVLEAGLGGQNDATNIVENTICSVITQIGYDHTSILGNTLEEIAYQKAGIIKGNCPVVTTSENEAVLKIIEEIATKKEATLAIAKTNDNMIKYKMELDKRAQIIQYVSYKEFEDVEIFQPGLYQVKNACLVLEVVRVLKERIDISLEAIYEGMRSLYLPGRMELIKEKNRPLVILDGAHNPLAAGELRKSLDVYFPNSHIVYLMGVFKDKEYTQMIDSILPDKAFVVAVPPISKRSLLPKELKRVIEQTNQQRQVAIADTFQEALQIAYDKKPDLVVAFGSLSYLRFIKEIISQND